MIVCVCRRISDRQIRAAAEGGATTLEDLQQIGVALQCGKCAEMALQIMNDTNAALMAELYYPAA